MIKSYKDLIVWQKELREVTSARRLLRLPRLVSLSRDSRNDKEGFLILDNKRAPDAETRLVKTPIAKIVMAAAFLLMVIPFISTFNEFLTSVFLHFKYYRILEEAVVPYESKVLAGIFNVFGFNSNGVAKGFWLNGVFFEVQWNCLGWQSAVLLLASLLSGFQGKFSWSSRFEVVLIGFLGTFLVNIFRLFTVGFLAVTVGTSFAIIFHDYFALVLVIIWFIFFWWFSYSYVLEKG